MDTDAEDVAWALQTAETLWKRGERADAIVWLRRAAQSAGDAQDDDRALVLARAAAELAEFMAHDPMISDAHASEAMPSAEVHGVDDLLGTDIPISISEPALPIAEPASPPPAPVVAPPPPRLPSSPADDEPTTLEIDVREAYRKASAGAGTAAPRSEGSAPSAAEAHRGMLDPWAAPPPLPKPPPRPPSPPDDMDDEEVVTSAGNLPSAAVVQPPAEPPPPTAEVPTPEMISAPPPDAMSAPPPEPEVVPPPPVAAKPPKPPPPLPPRKPPPPVPKKPKKMAARRERPRKEMPSQPPPDALPPQHEEEGKVYTADPISMLSAARGGAPSRPPSIPPEGPGSLDAVTMEAKTVEAPQIVRPPPEPTLVSAQPVPPPRIPTPPPPPPAEEEPPEEPTIEGPVVMAIDLKLGDVPGLSDLPDEEREKLQKSAAIHKLSHGEEVGGFALALVVRGDVDVAAQIVDVPADRIGQGTVLRGRGTIAEGVPLRLLCASKEAVVATWQAAEIDPALETCPWVVDDLKAQADRVQALVGVTLGPLADRLDTELRRQVTSRLTLRELQEGEVIVEQGKPVRQLLIVGQGHVELAKDGDAHGSVGAGELLFPSEILSAGKAPATAKAGKGGALVLQADRLVAQELMVTCPPLLEIFGGM